jgi:hypothetical protein
MNSTTSPELTVVTPPSIIHMQNKTALERLVDDVVAVLDEGPAGFDPQVAMTLAIATPVVLLVMCVMCFVCRGVPYVCCDGKCTYWKRMPKEPNGLEPDGALGEHQDEHCDVDSADEESRADQPQVMGDDASLENVELGKNDGGGGQRECCAAMAAVLESGSMDSSDHHSTPSSPSSTASEMPPLVFAEKEKHVGTKKGKARAVTIHTPE